MIEPVMFFALGFLGATLIALIALFVVWRRAARLTKKRTEAAVPVSTTEVQGDGGRLPAKFAMPARNPENDVERLKLKASEHLAEIARKREAARLLKSEVEEEIARATAREAQIDASRGKLNAAEADLASKSRLLHDAEEALAAKEKQIADAGRAINEIADGPGGARIETAALQTQCDTLKNNIEILKREVAAIETRLTEARQVDERTTRSHASEQNAAEALKTQLGEMEALFSNFHHEAEALSATFEEMTQEQQRAADIAAQREEELQARLAAHESELKNDAAAAREQLKVANDAAQRARAELQKLHDEVRGKTEAFQATVEILRSEKSQSQDALAELRDERDRLLSEADSLRAQLQESRAEERMENAVLREHVNDIAAEIARLAMNLEGTASPIEELLAASAAQGNGHTDGATPATGDTRVSLAQRIRNMQSRAR